MASGSRRSNALTSGELGARSRFSHPARERAPQPRLTGTSAACTEAVTPRSIARCRRFALFRGGNVPLTHGERAMGRWPAALELLRCDDDRHVAECLWKVAEKLAGVGINLLGQKSHVIGVTQELIEHLFGLGPPVLHRQDVDQPESAQQKAGVFSLEAVGNLLGQV